MAKFADNAFTGDGAKLAGGRWNRPGLPVIYTADSTAAAVLEIAVHLDAAMVKQRFVLIPVDIEVSLVEYVDPGKLPSAWRRPNRSAPIALGNDWITSARTAVLAVPSAIVPSATNYLLNPRHPSFRSIIFFGRRISHWIDTRLKTG